MLKEALEDALARGEKLRNEISKDILNSQIFADLANNPRFVNAVALVIRSREEVARSVQKRVKETVEGMKIATRQQLRAYERRVTRLEKELDSVARKMMMKKGTGSKVTKTTKKKIIAQKTMAKKAAPKKTVKKVTAPVQGSASAATPAETVTTVNA